MRTSAWWSQLFTVNVSVLPFHQQILNLTFIVDLHDVQNENPDAGKSTMTPIAVLSAKNDKVKIMQLTSMTNWMSNIVNSLHPTLITTVQPPKVS